MPSGQVVVVPDVSGDTLELLVELVARARGAAAASWCAARPMDRSKLGSPTTPRCANWSSIARTRVWTRQTDHNLHVAPLTLGPDEPLRLHIFLDRSVLEVFVNERVSISSRIYPTRADSLGLALLADRGDAQLRHPTRGNCAQFGRGSDGARCQ